MFNIFSVILILLVSNISIAGDKVGNGGGLWACSLNQNLTQGMLVDLYEAEEEFSLQLIQTNQLDPFEIVNERNDFIKKNIPQYFYRWNQKLNESLGKIHYVNSELTIIDDALYRVKPLSSTCSGGWVYTQFANYTNQDQILIREDLWKSQLISSVHKAALIWHEVIYAWLREEFQEKNSVRARQIVGIIFSQLPVKGMKDKIDKVLSSNSQHSDQTYWFCMMRNNYSFKYFGNYGLSQVEAATKASQSCSDSQNSFGCDDHDIKCDQILFQISKVTCQIKNYYTNKSYWSNGLIALEAEYKVREQCQNDGEAVHCDHPATCQ